MLLPWAVLATVVGLAGYGAANGAANAQAYVYWTNNGPGIASNGSTLGRADNDGSGVTHSFLTDAGAPGAIAVDGAHIYWADSQQQSIGRANLDGSDADATFIPNATGLGASTSPSGVALDGTYVYWTDGERYIGRATLEGQSVQPHFIDAGPDSFPIGIVVVAGTIYFTEFSQIMSVPAGGGTPASLVTLPAQSAPTALTATGGHLYWSALNLADASPSGSIGRVLTSGGGLEEDFVAGLDYPTGVATDGTEIYWVDHTAGMIGRALLGSSGATNIELDFASEPGGPWGVAVDGLIDPTQTSVSCTPTSLSAGAPTSCTAIVSDSASSSTPTGTVVFSGNGSTFFSGSSSCTLTALAGGGASCVVGAVPLSAGEVPIDAAYSGDPVHAPSAAATSVCDGTSAECAGAVGGASGGSGGTGSGPAGGSTAVAHCIVPKLKGDTLARARKLLARARCSLGKVAKPRPSRHKPRPLVVGSQRPAAGRELAVNAKVALGLVQAKPPRRSRRVIHV
jgi:virginiamycin B lyase